MGIERAEKIVNRNEVNCKEKDITEKVNNITSLDDNIEQTMKNIGEDETEQIAKTKNLNLSEKEIHLTEMMENEVNCDENYIKEKYNMVTSIEHVENNYTKLV